MLCNNKQIIVLILFTGNRLVFNIILQIQNLQEKGLKVNDITVKAEKMETWLVKLIKGSMHSCVGNFLGQY